MLPSNAHRHLLNSRGQKGRQVCLQEFMAGGAHVWYDPWKASTWRDSQAVGDTSEVRPDMKAKNELRWRNRGSQNREGASQLIAMMVIGHQEWLQRQTESCAHKSVIKLKKWHFLHYSGRVWVYLVVLCTWYLLTVHSVQRTVVPATTEIMKIVMRPLPSDTIQSGCYGKASNNNIDHVKIGYMLLSSPWIFLRT